MRQPSRRKLAKESPLGVKLLRSAQQARDWVNGKPGRVRVTYVPVPQVDVRKLRSKMGLSQTQFAARFGFSLDSIQNWEQGHRRPEGPARILLAVIAKNSKAVQEALGESSEKDSLPTTAGDDESPVAAEPATTEADVQGVLAMVYLQSGGKFGITPMDFTRSYLNEKLNQAGDAVRKVVKDKSGKTTND